ncbi:MAG: S-layer homology domain-containing protein [Halanaerobiales bacterium]|nr:S-layer homology domain-containing protein [Halanaerobiales bacterium]
MRKFTVVIALLLVVALATPALGASFPDVPATHWAYQAVNKLVAAGVVEGYPDGTYKGQRNLTRYEMAMIVSRALDNIAEQRKAMLAEIKASQPEVKETKAGLTTEQAQDVTAIVKALMQKNMPEVPELPEGLTDQQVDEVANLVEALTFEYQAELKVLGSDIDQLNMDLAKVKARVAALENAEPTVAFSGLFSVDFSNTNVDGTGIVPADEADAEAVFGPYTATEYFFVDPYSTASGSYVEQLDSDTDNEFDSTHSTPDFRMTDGEDYYTDDLTDDLSFENSLDLNIAVKKGPLTADLDLTASTNEFGGTDSNGFTLDALSGTIVAPDFTATVGDEQEVTFTDYLFDGAAVDGVVANTDNHTFFVSRTVEEEDLVYTGVVYGDSDDYTATDKTYTRAGAKMGFNLMLPVNVYVGYEFNETDDAVLAVMGMDTSMDLAGLTVTADVASSFYNGVTDYLFRLGATGDMGPLSVAANFVREDGFTPIVGAAPASGYDVEVSGSLAMVNGSVYYGDYGTSELTLKAEVPAGNLSFANVNLDGSYRYTIMGDDGFKEERYINASTSLAGFNLGYGYEYVADNEIFDPEEDRVDDGQPSALEESDADANTHTLTAGYSLFNEMVSLGFTSEFDKAMSNDATDIIWAGSFTNTNTFTADYANGPITAGLEYVLSGDTTLTGRYTAKLFEAGFEKVLSGDLVVDASVTSPTYTLMGVDVSAEAMYMRNIDAATQDMGVKAMLAKDVNNRLSLTGSMEYANKEIDVDYAGVKIAGKAGLEYSVTEDVSATAGYEYLNWTGDTQGDYVAQKATMGVDVAF